MTPELYKYHLRKCNDLSQTLKEIPSQLDVILSPTFLIFLEPKYLLTVRLQNYVFLLNRNNYC